jgi:hypothetical protein
MFERLSSDSFKKTHSSEGVVVGEVLKDSGYSFAEGEIVVFADSPSSLFSYMKEHMPHPKREEASSRVLSGSNEFNAFRTYEEMFDTFQNHPEKIRKFTEKQEMVKVSDNAGIDVSFDVYGDFLDISRVLEGVPETYGQFTMGNPLGLFSTITVNGTASAYVGQEVINHRGQRILRLVDWLETQGIRTSIRLMNSSICSHVEVIVKDFDANFDLNTLAVSSHSEFLRRVIFRIDEHSKTWRSGYGRATRFSEIPSVEQLERGISLEIDWFESVHSVDSHFDRLEKDLEKFIEDQDTKFYQRVSPHE